MNSFEERLTAYEAKFAHDEEMTFKAEARANKKLGLWAAEKMGKTGDDADAYAREVIKADFEEPGFEDVVRKVTGDLDTVTAQEVRNKRIEFLAVAKAELVTEA